MFLFSLTLCLSPVAVLVFSEPLKGFQQTPICRLDSFTYSLLSNMKKMSGPGGLPGAQRVKADNSLVEDDEVRIIRSAHRVMEGTL